MLNICVLNPINHSFRAKLDIKTSSSISQRAFHGWKTSLKPANSRTTKVNAIFGSIPILSKEISNIKKGEPIRVNQFSDCVTQTYESSNFFSSFYSVLIQEYDAFFSPAGIEKSNSIALDINSP